MSESDAELAASSISNLFQATEVLYTDSAASASSASSSTEPAANAEMRSIASSRGAQVSQVLNTVSVALTANLAAGSSTQVTTPEFELGAHKLNLSAGASILAASTVQLPQAAGAALAAADSAQTVRMSL